MLLFLLLDLFTFLIVVFLSFVSFGLSDRCIHFFSFLWLLRVNLAGLICVRRMMYLFSLFFRLDFTFVSRIAHFSIHLKLLSAFSNLLYLFFDLYLHYLFLIIFKLLHYLNEILCKLLLIQFLFDVSLKHLLNFYQRKVHSIRICTAITFYYCY